jgi:hypothetical protein
VVIGRTGIHAKERDGDQEQDAGEDRCGGKRHRPFRLISLHGWSHSQSNPGLQAVTRTAYRTQRDLFADTVRRWQAAGSFDPEADPDGVAQLLQSIILGFVAQRALAGDADAHAHVSALDALASHCPAGHPGGRALRPAAPPPRAARELVRSS